MSEAERLAFVEARDGIDGAIDFARRTLKAYKAVVLKKNGRRSGYGSSYRRELVQSCIALRRFLRERQA